MLKISFTQNCPKYCARKAALKELGYNFILLTDNQIRATPLLDNLKLLYEEINIDRQLNEIETDALVFLSENTPSSLQELSKGLDIKDSYLKRNIAYLFNLHKVYIDINTELISDNPQICLPNPEAELNIKIHDEFDALPDEYKQENQFTKLENATKIKRDLDTFGDELKNEALQRYKLFSLIDKNLKAGWTKNNLEPLIDKYISYVDIPKPSWRTIINWKNKFIDNNGDLVAFAKDHHLKGNRSRKVTGDEEEFDAALERFLDAKRPSVRSAYKYYQDSIIIKNDNNKLNQTPIISYTSFNNRIKKLPPYPIALARHGKALADRWFNYCGKHKPPSRILERVEIDHTPLDLILLDDELSIPIGRPYLTLLIDVFSGCILGFHLGFKAPSYYSVSKAVLHSIKPKDYIHEKYPSIMSDWPCHGKIETLVVDNGAEFWSKNLEHACLEAKINIYFNQVRKPWLKPFIERLFKVINECFLDWIPGKTFCSILKKEDYKPDKDAVMHFSTFLEEFHRWIVDVYHQEADSRYTRIPYISWQRGVDVLPPKLIATEEMDYFSVIKGIKQEITLSSKGVQYKHLRYDSTALADYRKQYPQPAKGNIKLVKIDPDDLSHIYVFLKELGDCGQYLKVPCADPIGYTKKLSLQQHEIICYFQRTFIKEKINLLNLAKARQLLHEKITLEQQQISQPKNQIKAKNKQAVFAGVSNTGTGSIIIKNEPLEANETVQKDEEDIFERMNKNAERSNKTY